MSAARYHAVRALTETLAASLSPEDQTVQSMPDTSPTKWHRAHTTWFFETFLLRRFAACYQPFDPQYEYLFNSYYEAVGPRHARPERGLVTRPGVEEVTEYRRFVDDEMTVLLDCGMPASIAWLVELGLHHEQQHQELLVMDIHHAFSRNPCRPTYGALPWPVSGAGAPGWIGHAGGLVDVGHAAECFAFDNEQPRHRAHLEPFEVSSSLVTCGEWLEFVADGGYERAELWMSDGWATVQACGWRSPEYWFQSDGEWHVHALDRVGPVEAGAPVEHVSWYEADAFARWSGARLPLEAEWEQVAPDPDTAVSEGWYGAVWQWTASPYVSYPGFRPASGAVGEYNGKFMVNQQVLRGSAAPTPPGHARRTYRNFFPPHARWAFSGVRLARDVS